MSLFHKKCAQLLKNKHTVHKEYSLQWHIFRHHLYKSENKVNTFAPIDGSVPQFYLAIFLIILSFFLFSFLSFTSQVKTKFPFFSISLFKKFQVFQLQSINVFFCLNSNKIASLHKCPHLIYNMHNLPGSFTTK